MKLLWLVCIALTLLGAEGYMVGRGIADITGMVSEGILYGYANPSQDARGLHLRQYARTFIFANDDGSNPVVIVAAEMALVSQALRTEIVERLAEIYGDTYTYKNVLLSPNHSHSTPGGHNTFWMYQTPSGGFVQPTFDAYVNGIVKSIQLAHDDLQPGSIKMARGQIPFGTINRSGYSYDNNPEEEKDRYEDTVDDMMTLFRIQDENENDLAMLNFFAIHTTSLKNYNHLVSSDNKGYAAQMVERVLNPGAFPGQATVIAAFAQTAEGDASPNTDGELCDDTWEPCSYNTSACPADWDDPNLCNSYGPNREQFADCQDAGVHQFEKAMELWDEAEDELEGTIDFRHMWLNMSSVVVFEGDEENEPVTTCRPAMGYSFAAGATDGPGVRPFTQGDTEGKPVIDDILDRLINASDELIACQYPKPVLLPTGETLSPWKWQPEIIPFQLIKIGQVVIIAVPAEFTTMSGRRLSERVEQVLSDNGMEGTLPLIAGIANSFTSYVTTPEEYQMQRYEGASTTYGPNTLEAYLIKFGELAEALALGVDNDEGPDPEDYRGFPGNALGPLLTDVAPENMTYGDVLEDADSVYSQGDTVSAVFVAGNPRNDLMTDGTFLEVQRQDGEDWVVEFTDAHWETKFYWDSSCHDVIFPNRTGCNERQESTATIVWDIPEEQDEGVYRLAHYGSAKYPDGVVGEYEGVSSEFVVEGGKKEVKLTFNERYGHWFDK